MKYLQLPSPSSLLAPATAATTERTANLDCQGANHALIIVTLGAEANTNSTNVPITLSEADDTEATSFATFDADFNKTIDNTSATIYPISVDLEGRKRYLRLTITPDTTTNGAVLSSAVALLAKQVHSGTVTDYHANMEVG